MQTSLLDEEAHGERAGRADTKPVTVCWTNVNGMRAAWCAAPDGADEECSGNPDLQTHEPPGPACGADDVDRRSRQPDGGSVHRIAHDVKASGTPGYAGRAALGRCPDHGHGRSGNLESCPIDSLRRPRRRRGPGLWTQ